MKRLSIAIDGPAGAGKSSVAKVLARKLNYLYIDTGAMYRAVTWAVLEKNWDVQQGLEGFLEQLHLMMIPDGEGFKITIWNQDVTGFIRTPEVNNNVSKIAAIPAVREYLVARQRLLASAGGVILDGRDIGSVVLPNADIKFYLTASVESRAKRRYLEIKDSQPEMTLELIQQNVAERDAMDMSRETSPLVEVKDAIHIDSTTLTFDETVAKMQAIIEGHHDN